MGSKKQREVPCGFYDKPYDPEDHSVKMAFELLREEQKHIDRTMLIRNHLVTITGRLDDPTIQLNRDNTTTVFLDGYGDLWEMVYQWRIGAVYFTNQVCHHVSSRTSAKKWGFLWCGNAATSKTDAPTKNIRLYPKGTFDPKYQYQPSIQFVAHDALRRTFFTLQTIASNTTKTDIRIVMMDVDRTMHEIALVVGFDEEPQLFIGLDNKVYLFIYQSLSLTLNDATHNVSATPPFHCHEITVPSPFVKGNLKSQFRTYDCHRKRAFAETALATRNHCLDLVNRSPVVAKLLHNYNFQPDIVVRAFIDVCKTAATRLRHLMRLCHHPVREMQIMGDGECMVGGDVMYSFLWPLLFKGTAIYNNPYSEEERIGFIELLMTGVQTLLLCPDTPPFSRAGIVFSNDRMFFECVVRNWVGKYVSSKIPVESRVAFLEKWINAISIERWQMAVEAEQAYEKRQREEEMDDERGRTRMRRMNV